VEDGNVLTEISPSVPKAALKTLFFRTDMTLRDVFSAKSNSMYRWSLAACGPFYLPPSSSFHVEKKNEKKKTHSEAPEPRIATRTEAYDLDFTSASETKPIVEKKIDRPCAEVGAYIDQRRAWLL